MSSTSLPSTSSPESGTTVTKTTGESDSQESVDFYKSSGTLSYPEHSGDVSAEAHGELLAFYLQGRNTGQRLHDAGLLPLSLYEYVNASASRGPYPICLGTRADDEPISLTSIVDQLIGVDGDPSIDKERTRLLLRMDAAIRKAFAVHPDLPLLKLWDLAAGKLAPPGDSEESRRSVETLAEARARIAIDGELVDFSREALLRMVDIATDLEWRGRFAPVEGDTESLVIQIDDFLRADFSESEESRTPDHLRASVGKTFAAELDFEALSGIMADEGHEMSESRRRRLESIRDDLRDLPRILSENRSAGVLHGEAGLEEATANVHRDLKTIARLARAVQIAMLEIAGKYREDAHDAAFEAFDVEHLTDEETSVCPPYVVDVGPASNLSASGRSRLMDLLTSKMPIKVLLRVEALDTGFADPLRGASPSASVQTAVQATGLGTAYVFQSPGSESEAIARAARIGARFPGPALYSIYSGSQSAIDDLNAYMRSAIALESRAFCQFEFNPTGDDWTERFSIEGNPDVERHWGVTDVEVDRDGTLSEMTAPFTFADFLLCDGRCLDHFRDVPPGMWHEAMVPIDEYLPLTEADAGDRIPYVWAADDAGFLHRVVPTHRVVEAVRFVLSRWRTFQELGGIDSSLAARAVEQAEKRLEQEKSEALDEVRHAYEAELERTTGEVARNIVSNIAAGLLGLQHSGPAPARPAQPPTTALPSEPSESTTQAKTVTTTQGADVSAADEDEEEVIALDDPYIETVRCTTCNECTNINSRLFAYDDNQQAYIKDASAGTFRELVLAAEKCPVRIIHPGKPLNPNEPGLDDLVERAKPYL